MPTAHLLSEMMGVIFCGCPKSCSVVRCSTAYFPRMNSAAYSDSAAEEHTVGITVLM